MLEEKISKHLGVPYIYIPSKRIFLCENGVPFTKEEYKDIDINAEYEKRKESDELYDYVYAKNTGILRKKRGLAKKDLHSTTQDSSKSTQEESVQTMEEGQNTNTRIQYRTDVDRRVGDSKGLRHNEAVRRNTNSTKSILGIILLLGFTSVISMYISTLHTATYLFDYVDIISAWLMSASVTAYNATAFEVSVIFKTNKRYFMSVIFMVLWALVTLFSMATTVSVFYDRFNFQETQIAMENKQADSNKLALELLQKKESDLREAIDFKKKDIEYRQEKDYATATVRTELNKLQDELQSVLSEQEKLLRETPEVVETKVQRKESLFSFLGRLLHLEGGILEFIMSTLSAIFVNIIAPLSLTAVIELRRKEE